MNWFKRDWELIKEYRLPSKLELLNEHKLAPETASEWMLQRKLVLIFKCKLTNKIKKVVETY